MEKQFHQRGLRLTPQRRAILAAIRQTPEHLTAEEIYERVKEDYPGTNLATVYRNLHLLNELNLLRRLDFGTGQSRYEGNLEHHHHLVCLGCGTIRDLLECPLETGHWIPGITGFNINYHTFTAYGYCADCEEKE